MPLNGDLNEYGTVRRLGSLDNVDSFTPVSGPDERGIDFSDILFTAVSFDDTQRDTIAFTVTF